MKSSICMIMLLMTTINLFGKEKLPMKYCISYGFEKAEIQITEYFSFGCPQCIQLFKEDFFALKEKYCDSDKILYIFHPDPADILTIQAMICLEKLSNERKKLFLETVLVELEKVDLTVGAKFMQKAMEVFKIPIAMLDNHEYIKKTSAFKDAFNYLSQPRFIKGVPSIEVNGEVFDNLPNKKFIEEKIRNIERSKKQ